MDKAEGKVGDRKKQMIKTEILLFKITDKKISDKMDDNDK